MNYAFKTTPYEHQISALEKGWNKREYGYFMEMGTGKSKVIIDTAAMLFDSGEIEGFCVIAPKGVYRNWTNKEIPAHMPDHIPLRVATWKANLNSAVKASINRLFEVNADLNVFIINIDAVITKKGSDVLAKFLDTRKVLLVVDESTIIKTPKALRTKAMVKLGPKAAYRRILTGSPVTKSPLDLYTQCEFLNPRLLGYSSFYGFRGHFADTVNQNFGGRTFKQITGYKNLEELKDILQDFTYRVTKDECLDLPDKIYMRREFEMSKEQAKAYKEMKEFAMTELEGEDASVTSVIVQLLRLHQITCGHLTKDENSDVKYFLANTQTGGYGITLTAAHDVIYYSNNYDLEKRLQSEDRAHRIGQNNHVTYTDLVCRNTVDEKIINALRNKNDMARLITGDQWKEWL